MFTKQKYPRQRDMHSAISQNEARDIFGIERKIGFRVIGCLWIEIFN
jgi:hypothetical protein